VNVSVEPSQFGHLTDSDPLLRLVFEHVLRVRGERRFAALADIDFFAVPAAVPHMFTMAVSGTPPRFRYKFSGTQVDRILGLNPMGRYLDDIYARPDHPIRVSYAELARIQKPQILRAAFMPSTGLPRLLLRLAIPLSADGAAMTHVVGVLVMHFDRSGVTEIPKPGPPSVIDIAYLDA